MEWIRLLLARLLPAFCALALLPPPPLLRGDTPTKRYPNPVHKFSLNIFPEWAQVPIEVGEKFEVAKFYEPTNRGDSFRPELTVFRMDKRGDQGAAPVTGLDPAKEKERAKERHEGPPVPATMYELAFGRLMNFDLKKFPADKNWKKVASKDKVEGRIWVVEIPFGPPGRPDSTLLAMLASFEKDGIEYGIRLTSAARRRDNYEPAMRQIAKTFLFFDANAKEVASLSVLGGVNISAQRRSDIEKGMVKGWAVHVSPKKNYVIVYNTKNNKNTELAKVLASRIEAIRQQVYEKQFPPSAPVTTVSVVRVCADAGEYHSYGGPGGSAGYWNSGTEELVFYDASPAKKVDDNTLAVLYHEAFHQYIYYSVGSVAPHSWFNEGHGDYYAGAEYKQGKFKIEPFNWRVGVVKNAIIQGPRPFTVKKDEKTGKEEKVWSNAKGYTPLKDLVRFSQGEYYSYPSVSYAQGWSLIYFLREGVPKNKKYLAKWGRILPTYFDALKREVAKEDNPLAGAPRPTGDPDDPKGPPEPPAPGDPVPPTEPDDPSGPGDPADPGDPAEPADPDAPGEPKPDEPDGGGEDGGDGSDEPPTDPGLQPMQEGYASENALQTALREAFEGVDFDELEKAWLEFTKGV